MTRYRPAIVTALILGVGVTNADRACAWGTTGQRVISRVAIRSLPPELPNFLKTAEAARQIGEVAREPRRVQTSDIDPAHYIEVGDDFKVSRGPSLSALPPNRESYDTALRAVGSNEYRAGYLPFAILNAWEQLVVDFAYFRADVAGVKYARLPSEQSFFFRDQHLREGLTIRDLGVLSHFVADGSQPLRVSIHRNGWGNFSNPQRFSYDTNLFARIESAAARLRIAENDISGIVIPYRDCQCGIATRISEYLSATQKQIVPLYQIEKASGFDGKHDAGKTFVQERLAAASSELRDLIRDAWHMSAEASIGNPPIALADIESGKANALGPLTGDD